MERHEEIYKNRKHIFYNNFLGGFAWGLGATIGVSIFFTIFGLVVSKINLIPFVGNFISGIITYVLQNNPNLLK